MCDFFKGFNFDTLLAAISCITGIAALFVGGAAYKKCNINKNSFNDKKKFKGGGTDNSQKAGGNITNYNGVDAQTLIAISSYNYKEALNQAKEFFEDRMNDNLQNIINETKQLIEDNRIDFGNYTKIDWINMYFDSAKTASDEYMQKVWAKVLAKELETPNSFSFHTIDILKNMSADDFRLFEKLCELQVEGYILPDNQLNDKYELKWSYKLKLKELGLINLDDSQLTKTVMSNKANGMVYQNKYFIQFTNNTNCNKDIQMQVQILSTTAKELLEIANYTYNEDYIIDFAKLIKTTNSSNCDITLHRINSIFDRNIEYDETDMLK